MEKSPHSSPQHKSTHTPRASRFAGLAEPPVGSYDDIYIAVVVPAFNEELLIAGVLDTLPQYVDKAIVVDDGSTDATRTIVEAFCQQDPARFELVSHESNRGVGAAIATGYQWCHREGVDIAVVMAGDGQMDPADLDRLLEPIVAGVADYAKGNRLFTGLAWERIPKWRYLGNSTLSLLTKIASGYWHVADSQSGYTAINSRALELIDWNEMYTSYGQPNDLLVRLNVYNLRVRDVPVRPVYNIGEKSGIRPHRVIPALSILLIKLFVWRMVQKYVIRDFHPLVLFYGSGFLLQIVSSIFLGRMVWMWLWTGNLPLMNTLLFVFTAISGVQFILFAMWFDMEHNRHLGR